MPYLIVIALVLTLAPAQLQAEEPVRRQFLVSVKGDIQDGDSLQLSVVFGDLFKGGAKIYSEPSHSLLLLAIDHSTEGTPRALAMLDEARENVDTAVVQTQVAGSAPRVNGLRRPAGDDGISIYALTEHDEHLVAAGKIGSGSFSFTTEVVADDGVSLTDPANLIGRKIEHCCNSSCGLKGCLECNGPYFTCCNCNEIQCGWVECV